MRSRIYTGMVTHQRLKPHKHGFCYRVFLFYLDLDELPGLFDRFLLWSARKFNLAWFRRTDHYGNPGQSLKESISALVQEKTGRRPTGPICLLTHLRYFGYVMNPVSFYYCWNQDATVVETIVAEVHNTPWGEQHCYVLDGKDKDTLIFDFDKEFHVSPFMSMQQQYRWLFSRPGERLLVHMSSFEKGELIFNAWSKLQAQEISSATLARVLVHYPFMTFKVISAIYWQAWLLRLKHTPFYEHPKHYLEHESHT